MTIARRIFRILVKGYKILTGKPKPPLPSMKVEKMEIKELEKVKPEEKPKKPQIKGILIPSVLPPKIKLEKIEKREKEKVSLVYPLIPKKPAKGEKVFAYAKIFWDGKNNRYFYQVVEPELDEKLLDVLSKIREILEEKLDIDFSKIKKEEAKEYLKDKIKEALEYFKFRLSEEERLIVEYYTERDLLGLGKIEPLMNDPQIEDISCDGVGIPIFVFHRNPEVGSVITNVVYETPEELDSFIMRLSQLCGKSISVANPLLGGALPDGSRVQATLASDIARRGSNFTIRKFTEVPLSPIHLLNYKTLDIKTLAFLWLVVDYGCSILVSGGTASGKTTLLNVLSLFIRPEKKIVSIEDTAELKLPHPHWVPHVARVPLAGEEKKIGEVDLFDLLKESLRQRPDYIVLGEVRGPEAFVLFQEMATGHPSLATIHAENIEKLTNRLLSPPISLPPSLLQSLDLIVFMARTRYREKQVRRITEIQEIIGFDREKNIPITNLIVKWDPMTDTFEVKNESAVLKKIAETKGMRDEEVIEELERRMVVLAWMYENNIIEYEDVYKVIRSYYASPLRVVALAKRGM